MSLLQSHKSCPSSLYDEFHGSMHGIIFMLRAQMTDSNNQRNINLLGDGSAGAGGVLVYTPLKTGSLAPNEFRDWARLVGALAGMGAGTKYVEIDADGVMDFDDAPAVPDSSGQPGGKWDMQGATIIGKLIPQTLVALNFDDGAQLTNILGFEGLLVRPRGSTPVITLGGGPGEQGNVNFGRGGLLSSGGGHSAPFIYAASTPIVPFLPNIIAFDTISGITDSGPPYSPFIEVDDGVALQIIFANDNPNVVDPGIGDWLIAPAGSTVSLILSSSANGQIDFSTMPSLLATPSITYTDSLERQYITRDLTVSALLPRIGYVVATAGAAATLPPPHLSAGPIILKNSTGAPVTVSPVAGTVDGGPSVVVAAGAIQTFKSDNAVGGDWQTF